jgi:hypothetical protein
MNIRRINHLSHEHANPGRSGYLNPQAYGSSETLELLRTLYKKQELSGDDISDIKNRFKIEFKDLRSKLVNVMSMEISDVEFLLKRRNKYYRIMDELNIKPSEV